MAVVLIGTDEFGRAQFKGLSTDTKPNAEVGSTFVETDTKNKFEQRATGSAGWVNTDIGGAASVAPESAPSAYFDLVTTAIAPASGAATYAIATGVRSLEYKSLTSTAAEYCLLGFGTSITDAETNRDAGQVIIAAGEKGSERIPANADYYSIKSASGTPVVQLLQKG